jgi:hypothetical protein
VFVPGVIAVMLAYINEEWEDRGVGRAMAYYVTGTVHSEARNICRK